MSLYNMLFGENPNTDIILAILGLKKNDVERYRDCGFCEEGIYIYTRTGGGNREYYKNKKLTSSPYYLSDSDDDFDYTYATYYFKIPDEIKQDVEQFKDVRKNGISAKLIQWVLKTIERKKTKNDIYSDLWDEQDRLVQQSKQTFICETNGHTIVPLDDRSTDKYLSLMEKAGGKQLSFSVMPYVVEVKENIDMCRVKISFPKDWEIDVELWNMWQERYGNKYPKSIKSIKEDVDEHL